MVKLEKGYLVLGVGKEKFTQVTKYKAD